MSPLIAPTPATQVIGLIGGLSWKSSAEYYRLINEEVVRRRGGMHSARCLMWSFDFADIEVLQRTDRWDEAAHLMVDAAQRLQRGGADFLVIATNTMHITAPHIEAAVDLPLLHIADTAAAPIKAAGLRRVGLLGTAFTMEGDFYTGRMARQHGLDVIVPAPADRATVHRIIYDELVQGRVVDASRQAYRQVIERLVARGAEAILLGCTEIMLLVGQQDSPVPLYDTTALHASAAVLRALSAGA
ncbi:aspartate/glutamate racemase family protein [Massilia sp. DWR3-1-1]|uniref:aspartate/glutamate racemase family protein n=1 Tax=Massilia sp. DWR3-1-1 TaxID=2804559 RepID=UPI003CED25ED